MLTYVQSNEHNNVMWVSQIKMFYQVSSYNLKKFPKLDENKCELKMIFYQHFYQNL